MSTEKIMDRIAKLLSLGDSPNKHEAEQALVKAKELAIKHNLEIADIAKKNGTTAKFGISMHVVWVPASTGPLFRVYESIATCFINCFDCKAVFSRMTYAKKTRWTFVGEEVDLNIAKVCLNWLPDYFEREFKLWQKIEDISGMPAHKMNQLRRSFYRGVASGIVTANQKVKETMKSESYALVVVDKKAQVNRFYEEQFPSARASVDRTQMRDQNASLAGYQSGKKVKLGHSIE